MIPSRIAIVSKPRSDQCTTNTNILQRKTAMKSKQKKPRKRPVYFQQFQSQSRSNLNPIQTPIYPIQSFYPYHSFRFHYTRDKFQRQLRLVRSLLSDLGFHGKESIDVDN